MLGILLIICLMIVWYTKFKAFILLKDTNNKSDINNIHKISAIRYRSVKLHFISGITGLIGYLGCIWPYFLIKETSNKYLITALFLGIIPILIIAFISYLDIRYSQGRTKACVSFSFYLLVLGLPFFYTSYCCIDYDFFRKDYTALFNSMGAETKQSENAWPYYIKAAVNYKNLEESFQNNLKENFKYSNSHLTNEQINELKKWFEANSESWENLKKASSINYCNVIYKNISFIEIADQNDFTNTPDAFIYPIMNFYGNLTSGQTEGIFDLSWLKLFQIELGTSRHFVNGKTFKQQLLGYQMLKLGVKLLANQENYTHEDLQEVRNALKKYLPAGLPEPNAEGEIFMICDSYADELGSLPMVTPLYPGLKELGSVSGTEKYARKQYQSVIEKIRTGVDKNSIFSISNFLTNRKEFFSKNDKTTNKVYQIYELVNTYLSAAYFLINLEEYNLIKGSYPVNISQLREAGLTSELPNDPYSQCKINYCNDGKRAILYSAGENTKDDGGYTDKKSSGQRDDIIFWQRNLNQ